MSESKSNAARHGLKVGDMVGILYPPEPHEYAIVGRIGRIKAIGSGIWDGFYAVFVNGEHWWFPESSLAKISRRGCFRRIKPWRKTAQASGRKEYTAGALASVPESPWQAKAENWRVMFPDGQNVKLEDVSAGAGSEPQPEAPKAEPKFKIGDRVEVYRCSCLWNILYDKVGAVGTVVCVNVNENTYMVDFRDGREYWWVPGRVLRHAPAEPSPATESAPEPEKPQFKPFDWVLVRNDNTEWRPAFFSYCDEGKNFPYFVINGGHTTNWRHCIPYDGNEELLGTTNDPEKG